MQFKHPEILYVLFALLIPVFIHLFQLQRFTKIAFTNVKFLKQAVLQTRKSSRLKKWLVLLTRLLAFAALILAFAQPYFSKNDTSKEWLTVVYLDNSISLQAKGEQGNLFNRAIQDLAENLPRQGNYVLLTNDNITGELTSKALIKELKALRFSPIQSDLKTLFIQIKQVFAQHPNKLHKLLFLSDFQNLKEKDFPSDLEIDLVKLKALKTNNIAIDSVFTTEGNLDNRTIEVVINNSSSSEINTSLSVISNQIILAKNTMLIAPNSKKKVQLSFPKEHNEITVTLNEDDRFSFDNTYYCSFKKKSKTKLMLVSDGQSFLKRIYTKDEFNLLETRSKSIPYEQISKQEVIVLDGISVIPESFQNKLVQFVNQGGSLVIIPNKASSIEDLNVFFNKLKIGQLKEHRKDSLQISKIHFSHPVLSRVFDKKVENFQYPVVTDLFSPQLSRATPILSYNNNQAFISQIKANKGTVFWVASSIDKSSSNFANAPLIVPVFYNIAKQTALQNRISYRVGEKNRIAIDESMDKDAVLRITDEKTDFIPLQQIKSDKVVLFTTTQPTKPGFYSVMNNENLIQKIAFNTAKSESNMQFSDLSELTSKNSHFKAFDNVKSVLTELASEQHIQSFFKWFVLLALLFLLIEILLLKFL